MTSPRMLPSELSIYTAGEVKDQCLGWMAEGTHGHGTEAEGFRLEAGAVDLVDAAGVQLLVSLSHSLANQSSRLCLALPSATLTEACVALGLSDWLEAHRIEGATA